VLQRVGRNAAVLEKPRRVALAVLLFAVAAGYFWVGALLDRLPIGLDESAFTAGATIQAAARWIWPELAWTVAGAFWVVVAVAGVAAVGFLTVGGAVRRRAARVDPARRRLLTGAASGIGAAIVAALLALASAVARTFFGVGRGGRGWAPVATDIFEAPVAKTHPEWPDAWRGSRVRAHRRFGRTDWMVSDIVLGTTDIVGEEGERIARIAIERGVNYIDTAPDYSAAGSEQAIGRAIRGVRERLFLATKFCTPLGHLPAGAPVAHYLRAVEGSLARLGTDYVDLCHVHSCNSVERLLDPNLHEAFERLRSEGKVRFLGFSSHTPDLIEVARAAIDSGHFDVMMLAYHHGLWTSLDAVIARARRERDMGVVAMKTLAGAKHHGLAGFGEHADAYSQAALKWTLSNADVSCAVISFAELQHVDEYLNASGGALTPGDRAILDAYNRQVSGTYCAPHCGACLSSCPQQLAIHDVLRHRMYFQDYGREREAARLYAQLERNASGCARCEAPCLGSCPLGVAIQERMIGAHEMLTRA
jgi:aryl-alcohol dehydrogenase-like predicted oxidoreductase